MKYSLRCLVLAVVALSSCNRDYKKASNGMLYIKYTDNEGPKIKAGDFVAVNIVARTDADSLIGSTYNDGIPRFITLPKPTFAGDYFDALTLMTVGDSLSVKMSDDSIFKHSPQPASFKGKFIIYELKVVKVIPKGNKTDQQLQSLVNFYLDGVRKEVASREPLKIKNYIADSKLLFTKTDSGLYYHINQPGRGPLAASGDTVVMNYTGSLFNGNIFDTNIKDEAIKSKIYNPGVPYKPIHFPIDKTKAFSGINQGLLLLNTGAKAKFIIPSKLAYGADGHNKIGPYTPIVFTIEVVSIIHPKPGTLKK
jgi:FKBP-type peptidyl-prolyl cis-trans isomerase